MITLLGIVGRNPASILVCARSVNVDQAVLIVSDETSEISSVLASQLHCPVEMITTPSSPSIEEVKTAIYSQGATFGSDKIILDITGGQKPMLLGIWESLQKMSLRAQVILYLNDMGRLMDATTGKTHSGSQASLQPEEFLAWRNASRRKCTWEGLLESIPNKYRVRARIAGELLKDRTWRDRDRSLSIIRRLNDQLTGEWYEKNVWLEEYSLVAASNALEKTSGIQARLGMEVLTSDKSSKAQANDENDIVLVNGARVVVVEAKARWTSAGSGDDLHKRIEKARYIFGDNARIIFVHPAWEEPPAALKTLVDKRVILIGNRNWSHYAKYLQDYLG
jgi:hypothetical protein